MARLFNPNNIPGGSFGKKLNANLPHIVDDLPPGFRVDLDARFHNLLPIDPYEIGQNGFFDRQWGGPVGIVRNVGTLGDGDPFDLDSFSPSSDVLDLVNSSAGDATITGDSTGGGLTGDDVFFTGDSTGTGLPGDTGLSTGSSSSFSASDLAKFATTIANDAGQIEVGQALRASLLPGTTATSSISDDLMALLSSPIAWLAVGGMILISVMDKPAKSSSTGKRK